ncbi:MAG: methyltransferase domain-containing protein [Clostridia bacterium]|nr:methyltransferase domain-containing protein [Clostridia bacterium]
MNQNTNSNWNFKQMVSEFVKPETEILVISGNEAENFVFELTKDVSKVKTVVTSSKKAEMLNAYGIAAEYSEGTNLPFEDESFNLVVCLCVPYSIDEVKRVLKKGGHLLTEQTGSSDADFNKELYPYPYNLENECVKLKNTGFRIVQRYQNYQYNGMLLSHAFVITAKK